MGKQIQSAALLSSATSTGAGGRHAAWSNYRTFQAIGSTSSGSGSITVDIEVSNSPVPGANDWIVLGTISLTPNQNDTDGFASAAAWRYARANVTAISGTGASVDV